MRLPCSGTALLWLGCAGYVSGINNSVQPAAVKSDSLKPVLHCKIERMSGQQLELLNRLLQQLEAEELSERLGEAFDQDQERGVLRRIPDLVREFRARHPYR